MGGKIQADVPGSLARTLRPVGETMRGWFPRRPLTGQEVAGIVVAAFFIVPLVIGVGLSAVMAVSTWPAVIGILAGAVGALIVQRSLALEAVAGRQRIGELERENAQLAGQVRQLEATVDQYIHQDEERKYRP
ncbi:MAG: hypothetical protein AB7P40_15760 [Chloroflexota bacterium]